MPSRKNLSEPLGLLSNKQNAGLDASNDSELVFATVALDPDGAIYAASQSVKSVLGYDPEKLIGTLFFRHVYKDDLLEIFRRITDLVNGQPSEDGILFRMRTGAGTWRTYRASARAQFENRHVVGILLTLISVLGV